MKAISALIALLALLIPSDRLDAAWIAQVGNIITLNEGIAGRPGGYGGGEFIIRENTNSVARTFCVQTQEFFNWGESLKIVGINDYSVQGNNPLRATTSALFREFQRGLSLGGTYNFFGSSSASYNFAADGSGLRTTAGDARALQEAIWYFQNQNGYMTRPTGNRFVDAAESLATSLGWNALTTTASSLTGTTQQNWGGVKILNLNRGSGYTVEAQDQLYYDNSFGSAPLPTPPAIPEPATLVLWGMGATGLGWIGRRRKK